MEIRRATADDALTVGTLLHDFDVEFDTPTDAPDVIAARFARLAGGDRVVVLLAGEPAIGFAVISFRPVLYADGPVALLEELYVRPAHRGRRVGHALLTATESAARDRGGPLVEINVDGDDHAARRFYEAHGYVHTEPGQSSPSLYYARAVDDPV